MSFFHWITGTVGYTAILGALGLALASLFAPPLENHYDVR